MNNLSYNKLLTHFIILVLLCIDLYYIPSLIICDLFQAVHNIIDKQCHSSTV